MNRNAQNAISKRPSKAEKRGELREISPIRADDKHEPCRVTRPRALHRKIARAKPAQNKKLDFTNEQLMDAVKAVGHAASSREISDKLGIKDHDQGRAYVRSRMAALMKERKSLESSLKTKADARSYTASSKRKPNFFW